MFLSRKFPNSTCRVGIKEVFKVSLEKYVQLKVKREDRIEENA